MTSAAEQDLMQSVIDAPDDDAPRLVLADWLRQKGEPRGEFIVTACTLTRPTCPSACAQAPPRRVAG